MRAFSLCLMGCLVGCLLLCTGIARAADERARIAAERSALQAGFAAEEAACRERFTVNACLDDTNTRRREALAGLRQQELLLDDADRKQRAASRAQAIEAKRIAGDPRPPQAAPPQWVVRQPPAAASAAGAASASASEPASASSPPPSAGLAERDKAQQAQSRDAARRAAAAQARRAQAQAERDKIAAREAARAARNKQSAPLPAPEPPASR